MSEIAVTIALAMIGIAMTLAMIRLWRGPTMADRVVALDMMTITLIALCGLYALRADQGAPAWLDIAVSLALVSFVSVVALARYAERQARRADSRHDTEES